jgi:hypothetical protein
MKLILLFAGLWLEWALSAHALTVSGTISSSTTWSDSVLVAGDVIVNNGTLVIQPGTVVRFATTNNNPVFGDASSVCLVVMPNGALWAEGAPEKRIVFTTASPMPDTGRWGKIQVIANDYRSRFSYCDIMYAQAGLCVENPTGYSAFSSVTPRNCRFYKLSTYAVYGNKGAGIELDKCDIGACRYGVFADGVARLSIRNTYIYNAAAGVVLGGQAAYPCTATIDHATFFDINAVRDPQARVWAGHGVFCTGTAYTLNLTNSIIKDCSQYGLAKDGWTLAEANNCWHGNTVGAIKETTLAAADITDNPLFANTSTFDLRLAEFSPCMGTAASNTNRGAWQLGEPWPPCQNFTPYYPLHVGDYWWYDNGLQREVTGMDTLNNQLYFIMRETGGVGGTQYIYERSDSMAVYHYSAICEETLYVFKPEMGFSWNVSCPAGAVTRQIFSLPPATDITIMENTTASAFVLKRYVGLYYYSDNQTGRQGNLWRAVVNGTVYNFGATPIKANPTSGSINGIVRVRHHTARDRIECTLPALPDYSSAVLSFYDVRGVRRCAMHVERQTKLLLPTGQLPAGVYQAVLTTDNGHYCGCKFVIIR